jgi:hypothetical protein
MDRHEVQRQEDSRIMMSYKMGSCQTTIFSSVTEDTNSQEEWIEGFASVIEGETN